MKSRTSCFNSVLFRKNLTRFAPVWCLYTLCLLLGMFLGKWLVGTEKGVALIGFICLVLSLALVMLYDRYIRRSGNKTPKIIAVHPFEEEMTHE
jgi:uncharacterized membrane protein YfcA